MNRRLKAAAVEFEFGFRRENEYEKTKARYGQPARVDAFFQERHPVLPANLEDLGAVFVAQSLFKLSLSFSAQKSSHHSNRVNLHKD